MDRSDITGLILAGGRGSRMGGADKGLQIHLGQALAMHAVLRLGPQVGRLMISANRNLETYAAMGVPVWPDALPDYAGPLAGFLTGLEHCETGYLATVPCDSPAFPLDLVARLAEGLAEAGAEIAVAATRDGDGSLQAQPVFCLMRTSLLDSLLAYTQSGQRKIAAWTARQRCALIEFDDESAFFNANTVADLQTLQDRR